MSVNSNLVKFWKKPLGMTKTRNFLNSKFNLKQASNVFVSVYKGINMWGLFLALGHVGCGRMCVHMVDSNCIVDKNARVGDDVLILNVDVCFSLHSTLCFVLLHFSNLFVHVTNLK